MPATATNAKAAQFTVATNDMSANVNNVIFKQSNDINDITAYGASGHLYQGSLTDGEITVDGFWDAAATVGSHTVLQGLVGNASGAAIVWGPAGSASGKVKHSFTGILQDYTESAPVAGVVLFAAVFKVSGSVTTGVYP